jgi:Sulfotransferase family
VIISNSSRYVFVHIHKTAGEAVTAALLSGCRRNDIVCGPVHRGRDTDKAFGTDYGGLHKHSHALEIREVMGGVLWHDYFTFSFVRNPYYRILSLYTYIEMMVQGQGVRRYVPPSLRKNRLWRWPGTKAYLDTRSFSEFIRHDDFVQHEPGAQPMVDWLTDQGKVLVSFIGKVESLEKDFAQITASIGMAQSAVPPKNVSRSRVRLRDYYRGADFDYVFDRYRADFETFGYDRSPG